MCESGDIINTITLRALGKAREMISKMRTDIATVGTPAEWQME